MYHRVAEESCDPWGLCVSPAAFADQMAVLAKYRAAVDLTAFSSGEGYSKSGASIAVTFDDAYVDNLTAALPIIEKYEIPITIFAVSQTLGRRREFWWDALTRAILESATLPVSLTLKLGEDVREFAIDDRPEDRALAQNWVADEDGPRTDREKLYVELWNAIVLLPPEAQDLVTDEILLWAGASLKGPESRYPATREELSGHAGHPLLHIGSHTRTHRSLPDLSLAEQAEEIEGGHRDLEETIGARIDRFSYPFGRLNSSAKKLVEALGVDVACTSAVSAATSTMDRLALPRLQSVERDEEAFTRWLQDEHHLLLRVGR
ncbi:polysaccharide deacetylase family protein [Sphingobium phenoxybenzoativorans]|uniref:polysaccharide deacetylase family protein n=1 Tax=Sphingobium phenoxybenzoativorans TaxID=1592790 RepID=UPI0008725153|nr:polysaccharide deacetylase family protein [Sphingobium phenoxybenzoativorans]